MVQIIFALRLCIGSAGHADCGPELLSVIEIVSGSSYCNGLLNNFDFSRSGRIRRRLLSAILKIDPFEFRWVRLSYPFVIGFALIMWMVFEIKNRRG